MAKLKTCPLINFLNSHGLLLDNEGKPDEELAKKIMTESKSEDIPVITYIVNNKLVSAEKIRDYFVNEFGYQPLELEEWSYDPANYPKSFEVDEKLVRKYHALPIAANATKLILALSDPLNLEAEEVYRLKYNYRNIEIYVVDDVKLEKAINKAFGDGYSDLDTSLLDDELGFEGDDQAPGLGEDTTDENAPAIVKWVNKMLLDAIKLGASDLHFEPYEKAYRVRFRIDGVLKEVQRPDVKLKDTIAARIKVMSRMDIAERRIPQDGRIKLKLPNSKKTMDLRVNTLPTLWGEKIVMRILDGSAAKLNIDMLGYEPEQKEKYLGALSKPQGLILVTGPTGSGKTVSLYTGLSILNDVETNISTAEDPVEINLEGINQVQINNKAGLTFASALRAFLRQDPDVIMVGEIRDLETAEIAIKAAQTGHLVLSTLHTNSAPETLTRLLNMGVPAFNIASSVTLIMAQRLARRLCEKCKVIDNVPEQELLKMGYTEQDIAQGLKIYKAKEGGCEACSNGYKGRVGIYEIFVMSEKLAMLIMEGGNSLQIAQLAEEEGMVPLRKSGLKKVAQGVTSLQEVSRVTSG